MGCNLVMILCYSLIYYELVLSLVDVELLRHAEIYSRRTSFCGVELDLRSTSKSNFNLWD